MNKKKIKKEVCRGTDKAMIWIKQHDRPLALVSVHAAGELLCCKKRHAMQWNCKCRIGIISVILFCLMTVLMLSCCLKKKGSEKCR